MTFTFKQVDCDVVFHMVSILSGVSVTPGPDIKGAFALSFTITPRTHRHEPHQLTADDLLPDEPAVRFSRSKPSEERDRLGYTTLDFQPNEAKVFSGSWDQTNNAANAVSPGTYDAQGYIATQEEWQKTERGNFMPSELRTLRTTFAIQ